MFWKVINVIYTYVEAGSCQLYLFTFIYGQLRRNQSFPLGNSVGKDADVHLELPDTCSKLTLVPPCCK